MCQKVRQTCSISHWKLCDGWLNRPQISKIGNYVIEGWTDHIYQKLGIWIYTIKLKRKNQKYRSGYTLKLKKKRKKNGSTCSS